jgi:hypothetical protein
VKPEDGGESADVIGVGCVRDGFEKVTALPGEVRERLTLDLVTAIRFWRAGVRAGKQGLSDEAIARDVFLADVKRALEQAGRPATRWGKSDVLESPYFQLAHKLGEAFGISLPNDLQRAAKRATDVTYGQMSPAMAAWQAAELPAWRQIRRRRITAALPARFEEVWARRRTRG